MSDRPHLLAGEDLPPSPRQRRSKEKRERILEAGLALFGERGYERTSIQEVAQRAGVAVGGVYLQFRSKRQLLLSLMDELLRALERVKLQLGPAPRARDRLRALLGRALATDLRYLGAYRAWEEAVVGDVELVALHREIHGWSTQRVLAVLRALRRAPGARRDVDLPGLARVLDTLFWSFLSQALLLRKAEVERWIEAVTHLVYHAMFTDTARKGRSS